MLIFPGKVRSLDQRSSLGHDTHRTLWELEQRVGARVEDVYSEDGDHLSCYCTGCSRLQLVFFCINQEATQVILPGNLRWASMDKWPCDSGKVNGLVGKSPPKQTYRVSGVHLRHLPVAIDEIWFGEISCNECTFSSVSLTSFYVS